MVILTCHLQPGLLQTATTVIAPLIAVIAPSPLMPVMNIAWHPV